MCSNSDATFFNIHRVFLLNRCVALKIKIIIFFYKKVKYFLGEDLILTVLYGNQ